MLFTELLDNLVEVLRDRVRNGEITERQLAKITGISQPHMHNVIKGVKVPSPELSDRILKEIRLSVCDLWSPETVSADAGIPIVQDPVGPGNPYPRECYSGAHPFSMEMRAGLAHPVVFRLRRDAQMAPDVMEKDLVLVDRSREVRRSPDARSMYLVEFEGSGLIRYTRRRGPGIWLASSETRDCPALWQRAAVDGRDILEVIRGRIVWIGRQMETPSGPVDETGPGTGPPGGAGRESGRGDGSGGSGAPARRADPACDLRGFHQASECSDDEDGNAADTDGVRRRDVP